MKITLSNKRRMLVIGIVLGLLILLTLLWMSSQNAAQLSAQLATVEAARVAEKNTATAAADKQAAALAEINVQKKQAEAQARTALARQLAGQAQALFASDDAKQIQAVLLAIQSMRLFPSGQASQILQSSTLAYPDLRLHHAQPVTLLAFSPDGKYILTASLDKKVRVWDVLTGKEIAHMTHGLDITAIAFSPDSKFVVSAGCDQPKGPTFCAQGSARVWEAATGKEIARITQAGRVKYAVFSADGQLIISGGCDSLTYSDAPCVDGAAHLWQAATSKEIARLQHGSYVSAVAFSADGKYIVSGGCDQPEGYCRHTSLRIWEVATGKETARMQLDQDVTAVAFSRYPDLVAALRDDGILHVWQVATRKEIFHVNAGMNSATVAFIPGSNGMPRVVATGPTGARVWEVATGREIAYITTNSNMRPIDFTMEDVNSIVGDVHLLTLTQAGNATRIWELLTGKEVAIMLPKEGIASAAFSPDGRYAVTAGDGSLFAQVWQLPGAKEKTAAPLTPEMVRMPHPPEEVANQIMQDVPLADLHFGAISADGKYMALLQRGGTAYLWDVAASKKIAQAKYDELYIMSAAFSPDDKVFAFGGNDPVVRIWNIEKGTITRRVTENDVTSSVAAITFSPDGKLMVTGDKHLQVWDFATGKEILRMLPEDGITSVAFSPDGRYLISAGFTSIRIWELANGLQLAQAPRKGVKEVAFSSNGKDALYRGADNIIRLWKWSADDMIAETCLRVTRNLTTVEWQQYVGDALPYERTCPNLPLEREPTPYPYIPPTPVP